MSSNRQKLLTRVNWYLQSSLKHITEYITSNKFHYRGGRYRQVPLYYMLISVDNDLRGNGVHHDGWYPPDHAPLTINPLRAKFFRGNINMYLHFMSLLHIDMTQVLKIPSQVRPWNEYSLSTNKILKGNGATEFVDKAIQSLMIYVSLYTDESLFIVNVNERSNSRPLNQTF